MFSGVCLGFIYTQTHGYTQTCTKHKDPQTRIIPSLLNLADVQKIELLKLVMKGSAVRVRSEAPKRKTRNKAPSLIGGGNLLFLGLFLARYFDNNSDNIFS